MRTPDGEELGTHQGLMYYTLGQRQGLGIGGRNDRREEPWYVVAKDIRNNALIVAQGEHELLFSNWLIATNASWIGAPPDGLDGGLKCKAKIRYRQPDQGCVVVPQNDQALKVRFESAQKAVAPGQFVVFYDGEQCLGGAVIDKSG
jgi:tRNA-specific 2-thiouridylase